MHHIKEKRTRMGVSQVQLAGLAGMDPATLNRIEQGKANPNLKTIERLADALGVEVADFFPKAQDPLFEAVEQRRPEWFEAPATEPQAESLGAYLRDMRELAGYSLRGLARASRLDVAFLSRVEHGRWDGKPGRISDASLAAVAHALGLDPDEVFWMAGRLPPDFRNLMMEAGPGHWKSLRRRFARNG